MLNRKMLLVVFAVCTCLGLTLARGADKLSEGKIRVLLITGGHDYEEKEFNAAFDAIPDVTTTKATLPQAAAQLQPELADTIDVIVFYDMWVAGFSPEQQQAFVALLNRGIGVVALHHTLGGHQEWPEYAKIIGGKYQLTERVVDGQKVPGSTYDHDQDVSVHIADTDTSYHARAEGFPDPR